jgi:hypothetical protein
VKKKSVASHAAEMNPRQQQLYCIQLAAALIFACTMMNISLFVGLIDELWAESLKQQRLPRQRLGSDLSRKARVCVLIIPGGESVWNVTLPSLAASVKGETEFDFGVFMVMSGPNQTAEKWFRQHFPPESTLALVSLPVGFNESVAEMLIRSSDGCSFHFVIGSHTEFLSPGWAHALTRALQRLNPQYVGVVSPVGCKDCIFVRDSHRVLFSHRRHFRLHSCWAEWVRSVYGACRVTDVAGAAVSSSLVDVSACPANKSALFLDLVTRGRLFVRKFLSRNSLDSF